MDRGRDLLDRRAAKQLAYLNVAATVTFLVTTSWILGPFGETLAGKGIITFVVIGTVFPWVYAIEKLRLLGQRRRMLLCFVCTAFVASFFLFRLSAHEGTSENGIR